MMFPGLLCKQGDAGSIPVTSTNQLKSNRLSKHLFPMWAILESLGPFIPTYIKDRVAVVCGRAVVSVTPYQRPVRFKGGLPGEQEPSGLRATRKLTLAAAS